MKTTFKIKFIYFISIIIPLITVLAAVGCFLGMMQYGLPPDGDKIWTYAFSVSAVIAGVSWYGFRTLRADYRQQSYMGTSKDPTFGYKYKSEKERSVLDMITYQENEAALSEREYRGMIREGSKNPDKDLSGLTGMENVHERIAEMAADAKAGDKKHVQTYNMCFLGNPGTGKTTVAGIIAGYLHKYKILKHNEYVVVDGATLVSSGDPQRRVNLLIQRSKGKLIFIDEAYAMAENPAVGNMVLSILLNEMESDRKNTIVVFAGYKKEMRNLFLLNSGLQSRIRDYLFFEDYSDEELLEIFDNMISSQKFTADDDVFIKVLDVIYKSRDNGTFSNARSIRNIADGALSRYRIRAGKNKVIIPEDIVFNELKDNYFADVNFGG